MSALLGLWLRRDPLEYHDGVNLQEYVDSRPIIHRDPQGLCLGPCYGNHCGADHGNGGSTGGGEPANDGGTDSACMRHDACYDQHGESGPVPCGGKKSPERAWCDVQLCNMAKLILCYGTWNTEEERQALLAIVAWFCCDEDVGVHGSAGRCDERTVRRTVLTNQSE